MDKNGVWFEGLGAMGFGHVEVGTITAQPQPGSPKPNMERLIEQRALLNWMGFPNQGADRIARRLARNSRETVLGVNIGKSRKAETPAAATDYQTSVRTLAHLADYLVLNVSSPNTPGLRQMQAADVLTGLVEAVQDELARLELDVPILVKLGPDLDDDELDAVADVASAHGIAGLIATNTTVDRSRVSSKLLQPDQPAGLSGAPLRPRALEVLRRLRTRVGDDLVLIAVGGVSSPEDVWERISAGATLVQVHTGFIYGGPLWPRRVNRYLAARVREQGGGSIQELVGNEAPGHGNLDAIAVG